MENISKDGLANENRRKVLLGSAALSLMAVAPVAFSAAEHQHDHRKMAKTGANSDLIDAALDCIKKGEACKAHCIELVKSGNTKIADCLAAVEETLPMCEALVVLATSNSEHLGKLAKVCIDVCKTCEEACKEHEMHPECKACMESCASCIEACEKIAA